MRRRPGIAGLQRDVQAREQFKQAGQEVRLAGLAQMKQQLALFQAKLEQFARQYKADIRRDPVFRAQFHTMCANIGVDPLASNKGVWAELLGFGDFYYELGVQILEAAWASRPLNGGLMELGALRVAVSKRRGQLADPISDDDVLRAIGKLKVLGGGLQVEAIGGRQYLRSVPGELNLDKNRVLAEAAREEGGRGCVSMQELRARTGWSEQRSEGALQSLLRDGLAMVDDGAPAGVGRLYWFPAMLLATGSGQG